MCLIHSVGNSARGSSQCWHAAVQNFLLRICFRPLWNKFKAKRFRKTGRNICTTPQRSFLKTSSHRSKYCSGCSRGSGTTDLEDRDK